MSSNKQLLIKILNTIPTCGGGTAKITDIIYDTIPVACLEIGDDDIVRIFNKQGIAKVVAIDIQLPPMRDFRVMIYDEFVKVWERSDSEHRSRVSTTTDSKNLEYELMGMAR